MVSEITQLFITSAMELRLHRLQMSPQEDLSYQSKEGNFSIDT